MLMAVFLLMIQVRKRVKLSTSARAWRSVTSAAGPQTNTASRSASCAPFASVKSPRRIFARRRSPAGGLIYTHNRSTSSSTPGRRILISSFIDVPKHAELVDDASGPLATFSSRIRMCEALGLLQEAEADELHRIRKIRNRFSHEVHISFSDQQIKDLCRALTHRVGDNIRALHSRRKGCLALRERPSFSIS
jgi:hypothetical protein